MSRWRTMLFITLARNAADPSVRFGLPAQQTVVMGTRLEICARSLAWQRRLQALSQGSPETRRPPAQHPPHGHRVLVHADRADTPDAKVTAVKPR